MYISAKYDNHIPVLIRAVCFAAIYIATVVSANITPLETEVDLVAPSKPTFETRRYLYILLAMPSVQTLHFQ